MLNAPLVRDITRPLRLVDPSFEALTPTVKRLSRQASHRLVDPGGPVVRVRVSAFVQMRYLGEGSTLEIGFDRSFVQRFRREHARLFHSREGGGRIECTSVRATATAAPLRAERPRNPGRESGTAAHARTIEMWIDGKRHRVPITQRSALRGVARLRGPRLITEYSSTSFVAPGWTLRTDAAGNLHLER
jgi:N-methylhydantoinase A/oxoprolinase/acetone carboxylase beta subunit